LALRALNTETQLLGGSSNNL